MKNLSLKPDPHMKWIYDYSDRERYNSPEARDLRVRRDAALRTCPEWMIETAMINDQMAEEKAKPAREFRNFLLGQRIGLRP